MPDPIFTFNTIAVLHKRLTPGNRPIVGPITDMQTNSHPRVRSACEACHERKQRCIIPDAGGACHACLQNSRHCYFVPRYKAGRPRRTNRSNDTNNNTTITLASPPPSSTTSALVDQNELSTPYDQNDGINVATSGQLFLTGRTDSQLRSGQLEKDQPTLEVNMSGDLNDSLVFFDNDLGSLLDYSSCSFVDTTFPQPPTSKVQSQVLTVNANEDPLSSLAEQFTLMHQHENTCRRGGLKSSHLTSDHGEFPFQVIASIEEACKFALGLVRSRPSEQDASLDSVLLVTMLKATILKVIACSDVVLGAAESTLSAAPASERQDDESNTADGSTLMDCVLVLKQLDISLTRVKLCLTRGGWQQEPQVMLMFTSRLRSLHERISALIDKLCDEQ